MKCPGCEGALRTVEYEGIKVETCDACRGEWLDSDELKQIVRKRDAHFDEQERRAIAAAARVKGIRLDTVDRGLDCPKCAGRTDAVNYGGDTGIIIDSCPSCRGIWLDEGELEHIQQVVEGWEDNLPDDLAKYGASLRQVAAEVDAADNVRVSRFRFINALMNGILDIVT